MLVFQIVPLKDAGKELASQGIDKGSDRSFAFFWDVTTRNFCFRRLNLEP